MKVIFGKSITSKYDSKKLYKTVLEKFDEYNMNVFIVNNTPYKALSKKNEYREEAFQKHISNPTYTLVNEILDLEKEIEDFKFKVKYLKAQLTNEELMIFNHSIIERELDKMIMPIINKYSHSYYEIKISCYLKVAICFGIEQPLLTPEKVVTQ